MKMDGYFKEMKNWSLEKCISIEGVSQGIYAICNHRRNLGKFIVPYILHRRNFNCKLFQIYLRTHKTIHSFYFSWMPNAEWRKQKRRIDCGEYDNTFKMRVKSELWVNMKYRH
jgi:ADP-glucose pyrophosphorylase